jgi:hypothetical protein
MWGDQEFSKAEWGSVNYLVGPNGSGKTRFAEPLRQALSNAGMRPRYLSAERLAGLEKSVIWGQNSALYRGFDVGRYQDYKNYGNEQGLSADAFVILKEKIDVRIRIEAFLSTIFGRRIRFAEEGGFLKPKIQKILGAEYEMKESECHGLKELITLLAFLYDDDFNALIIDEPELHLHPQFQTFLLAEIRRMAGDPRVHAGSKVFFLITHSPYLLDFRVIDDLRQCLIFHADEPPTCIGTLSAQDDYSLKRLLPRLNTHHKQFFFAHRPIFVEGYTDQQLFTLVQDSRFKLLGANGACFIDVNGKDEQDFFFRLCRQLKIDAQFISDLDVLTRGNLRNSISDDERSKEFVTTHGIGTDWMDAVRELYKRLDILITAINASTAPDLADIKTAFQQATNTDSKRYRSLIAAIHHKELLRTNLPAQTGEIDYIVAKVTRISEAAQKAGVYLLPKGALENHLLSYVGSIYQPPEGSKTSIFEQERDFILSSPGVTAIESRYGDLIPILDATSGACEVSLKRYLEYAIGVFIGNVQVAFERGEINSVDSLKQHASVDWATHKRILDVISFQTSVGAFACRMKLKQIVDRDETEFGFTDTTVHSKFTFA